jgi:5-methylcytosine-specific restriction endonuclease McrA
MKRNPERTPNSQIVSALRRLWLRSRERATAIKRDHYTCQHCGQKQSRAQGRELSVAVHHLDGVDWDGLVDLIRDRLLQTPDRLQTLCSECHGAEHKTETEGGE